MTFFRKKCGNSYKYLSIGFFSFSDNQKNDIIFIYDKS